MDGWERLSPDRFTALIVQVGAFFRDVARHYRKPCDPQVLLEREVRYLEDPNHGIMVHWKDGEIEGMAVVDATEDPTGAPTLAVRWIHFKGFISFAESRARREMLLQFGRDHGFDYMVWETPRSDRAIQKAFPEAEKISTLWRVRLNDG